MFSYIFHTGSSLTTDIWTLLPIVSVSLPELNKQTFLYVPHALLKAVLLAEKNLIA